MKKFKEMKFRALFLSKFGKKIHFKLEQTRKSFYDYFF